MISFSSFGQNDNGSMDNVTWSSIRFRTQIDDKTRFDLRPIIRHNQNLSNYQNTSIDFVLNRKIGGGWYGQFLLRKWFIPDGLDRLFLWWDIGHSVDLVKDKLGLNNRARLHWALDTEGQKLADFIRIQQTFTPVVKGKLRPFFSFETWIQLNDVNAVRRIRTEPGFNWRINDALNLTVMYRWENFINIDNRRDENHYVTTLTIQL